MPIQIIEEEIGMRELSKKLSSVVATLALFVTAGMVNSVCFIFMYQPELPEGAEELYR